MNRVQRLVAETKPLVEALETEDPNQIKRATWIVVCDNLIAIQTADPKLTLPQIGKMFSKSREWVRDCVTWRTENSSSPTPFSRARRAEQGEASPDDSSARKVLRERPKKIVKDIAKAMEDPDVAQAVVKASSKAARNVATAASKDLIDRAPSSGRTKAQVDAASANRLPDPPPSDPWKEFRAGVKAGEECVERLSLAFEYMHPDAWNQPPSIIEGIERDAAELAPKLREQAEFLQGLADTASQYANR